MNEENISQDRSIWGMVAESGEKQVKIEKKVNHLEERMDRLESKYREQGLLILKALLEGIDEILSANEAVQEEEVSS